MTEQQIEDRVASLPIPRLAQPDDVVDAIHDLTVGTNLTTGQILVVDGRRTM
jgi:NAD(P)-dependent dehydrogenase (short-subunit alcohol dehydrogenase family)